ncbi:MAG: FAD-binding oxidoreductase, partial [Thermoleophilia bacterium]|nr:FAD-binding oxidoreductase [Thermoleophilia bacterium]
MPTTTPRRVRFAAIPLLRQLVLSLAARVLTSDVEPSMPEAPRRRMQPSERRVRVNDVHSQLNETEVAEIVAVDSLDAIRAAISRAAERDLPVSVSGGRHAMGGQQFCADGVQLDTRPLARVLDLDREGGTVEVEAGLQWPELLAYLRREQEGARFAWTFRQKQSGADRLSIGGAVSANAHGRGLAFKPFVDDVESLTLVDAKGDVVTCSRTQNRDLFRLVVGGYGLFGVVYSVRLRLVPRLTLERLVEVRSLDGVVDAFEQRIEDRFLYGDFQFATDPGDPGFLRRGIFSCYRPVAVDAPIPAGQRALSREDWKQLLLLAHVDKAKAWERYSTHYLSTSGQLYDSDAHQLTEYVDDYHAWLDAVTDAPERATEMITELYLPRDRLADFMREAARDFRTHGVDLVYGTVRLIERDDESFLAWAREPWACVIFNLHVVHTPTGLASAADAFRRLIDL